MASNNGEWKAMLVHQATDFTEMSLNGNLLIEKKKNPLTPNMPPWHFPLIDQVV